MTNHNLKPAIKERPILFSAPMVRAILEGRKTQTRRIVHPRFTDHIKDLPDGPVRVKYEPWTNYKGEQMPPEWILYSSDDPEEVSFHLGQLFGAPEDRLWVRETWQHSNYPDGPYDPDCEVFYRADYLDDPLGIDLELSPDGIRRKWKSAIHLPRSASRINLEIVTVGVERLHDISEEDAIAEGATWTDNGPREWANPNGSFDELNPVNGWKEGWSHTGETSPEKCLGSARMSYANLFESINGKGSWDLNPWVWKIEFKRV